jgi:hypothetical protein
LEKLSKRYGRKGKERIALLQTQIARDFLSNLDPSQPITADQVGQLDSVMDSVLDPKRKPSMDVLLWAAEAWSGLASRANEPELRKQCYARSDQLLKTASESDNLDASIAMSLRLRRVDLARDMGETEQSLALLSEILRKSPAAVDLQIKAAHLLLDEAKRSSDANQFAVAMAGRPDDSVWGWAKLTITLVRMHYDSEDKSRYLDRLLESGFHLNESRILQAQLSKTPGRRTQLLDDSRKHIRQLMATFALSSEEWTAKLESLQTMMGQGE